MKRFLKENEDKPSGEGWKKIKNKKANLDPSRFEYSSGKEWYREKPSSSNETSKIEKNDDSTSTLDELKKLWGPVKEKAKKLTDPNVPVEIVSKVAEYLYDVGKGVTKKVVDGVEKFFSTGTDILDTPDPGSSDTQTKINTEPKPQTPSYEETTISQDEILSGQKELNVGLKGNVVSKIQEMLFDLKYIDEYEDGIFDESLKQKIKEFQNKNSLPPTGKINQKTLKKIRELAGIDFEIEGTPYNESIKIKKLLEGNGDPEKKITTEEHEKQKNNLTLAQEVGCIAQKYDKFQQMDNNIIGLLGQTDKDNWLCFYGDIKYNGDINVENLTIKNQNKKSGENKNYKAIVPCRNWRNKIGTTDQLTFGQTAEVKALTGKNQSYTLTKPSETDIISKVYQKVDLNELLPSSFPEKNKHFIYWKSGYNINTSDWFTQTENFLKEAGFTLNQPTVGSTEANYGATIDQYFGKNNQAVENVPNKETQKIFPIRATIIDTLPTLKDCKINLEKLYRAYDGQEQVEDKNLPLLKLKVLRCQISKTFENRIFNDDNKVKLKKLIYDTSKYGLKGLMDAKILQTESKKNLLKNIIKENLIKLKNNKSHNLLIEENELVKKRLKMFENTQNKFKKNQNQFFKELISEIAILQNQGFNNQIVSQNIFDIFTGLFGEKGGQSILERFKEYIIDWLIDITSPMEHSKWVSESIRYTFKDISNSEIPKLLNCGFVVKKISSTLKEMIQMKLSNNKNLKNPIDKIMYNSINDSLHSSDFQSTLESGLSLLICDKIDKIANKLQFQSELIKQKALSK